MSKFFAFIGFVFSIIFFSIVLSSAITKKNWTDWVNVLVSVLIGIFFAYHLRSKN